MCGLRTVSQIHQWARSERVSEFLKKHFEIVGIPCYYWLLCLVKKVNPASLNQCFMRWVQTMMPEEGEEMTLSFDGKTIRSTGAMDGYERPLHILSAHIAELGLTLGQQAVVAKSNEIPALRELLEMLQVEGCMVVADALHCQRETADAIVVKGAAYLLSVKDNQQTLKDEIAGYVQEETLRKMMDTAMTIEKNGGRIEKRTAYSTTDISWLDNKEAWTRLSCLGAIHRQCETKDGLSDEWHYYISSRPLAATELLHFARMEWSVESMHWLLDVHFGEDFCRVEDEAAQLNLNMVRKIALNSIRHFKNLSGNKRAFSKLMFDCLLDPSALLPILQT
ncbi:ISAs1 family transposase [Eubacteriales bacterium OttesenSCG-928-A19]|nr:ISAs1 family transposase [Eubacteriales bacterium OttesenSCG-928-A19]